MKKILLLLGLIFSFLTNHAEAYEIRLHPKNGAQFTQEDIAAIEITGIQTTSNEYSQLEDSLFNIFKSLNNSTDYIIQFSDSALNNFEEIFVNGNFCSEKISKESLKIGPVVLPVELHDSYSQIPKCTSKFYIDVPVLSSYCTGWHADQRDARAELLDQFNLPDCFGSCKPWETCLSTNLVDGLDDDITLTEEQNQNQAYRLCISGTGTMDLFLVCGCLSIAL